MSLATLMDALDRAAADGRGIPFWLRDDDAVEPTAPLEDLLALTARHAVPLTLAAIPAGAGEALARRIAEADQVSVAVHGWSHRNHATAGEKKQELGLHRGPETVLREVGEGLSRIRALFGPQAVAMLVPPWNRIHPEIVAGLPDLRFRALSVFGAETRDAPLPLLNTHVDVIDWKGSRGGRPADILFDEIARRIDALSDPFDTVGILTHHLVHDTAVRDFLDALLSHTATHPACRWMRSEALLSEAGF